MSFKGRLSSRPLLIETKGGKKVNEDNEIADECPDEGEKDAPVERSDRER